ncbi:MAG: hypothetical protein M1828_001430 [Chrysothrix sp. TS-e1954]|nr:MAG: hypothetical protein M1828_001430 [Chrysothrix sp. TS-e1954]
MQEAGQQNDQPAADKSEQYLRSGKNRASVSKDVPAALGASLRRTNSILTDSSFDSRRQSIRSPTEDFLLPRASGPQEQLHQEPTLWHSLPVLALAIIPSIGGVFFKKGSIIITDIALLVMAAVYLNWVLMTPWALYHSAQTVKIAKPPILDNIDEGIVSDEITDLPVDTEPTPSVKKTRKTSDAQSADKTTESSQETAALRELQIHELFALAMCFVGPLMGAYILHVIRTQISHVGDELVSNLHLTLFVLGAELRPMRHSMKLLQARTLHLQRLVREDPHAVDQIDTALVQELMDRVNTVESNVSEVATKSLSSVDQTASITADNVKKAQHVLQTQVDALNRAVRRYEKRATAQTIQNESRLQDLEGRLKDALSLAAAAASYSQKNGVLHIALDYAKTIMALPFHAFASALRWPLQAFNNILPTLLIRMGVVRPGRRKRSNAKQASYSRPSYGDRETRNK